jgi:hypothetical protein
MRVLRPVAFSQLYRGLWPGGEVLGLVSNTYAPQRIPIRGPFIENKCNVTLKNRGLL